MTVNNARTEEAHMISEILKANGYKLYGLPEMKKNEQALLLRYLQNNEFNAEEMNGVAKLFESTLWKNNDQ